MDQSLVIWELWNRGNLRYKMRPHQQSLVYDFVKNNANLEIVINLPRRTGKTYLAAALCIERCQSTPNQIVKFGAPTFDQAQNVVRKAINNILLDCPESMKPEYKYGKIWVWPNGSELRAVGLNVENGERLRGDALDFCVLDEVREVKQLDYIVKNIIGLQFVGRKNPKLILMTTPPKSMDHDFTQIYVPKAIARGAYYTCTVDDNKDWTEEDEKLVCEELGITKGSPAYLRECMCRLDISDTTALVVPEWDNKYVQEWKRPKYFYPSVAVDLAYADYSAFLYGYVDFEKTKIIIEDEIVVNNKNTKQLAELASKKEEDLWSTCIRYRDRERFGDCTLQQRHDLEDLYRYYIREVDKYDKDEAIASMRASIGNGKIIINPKCKNLIYQLQNGLWNDRRTDFLRTERAGHLDALMALVYMNRTISHENPSAEYNRNSQFNKLDEDWYQEANDE